MKHGLLYHTPQIANDKFRKKDWLESLSILKIFILYIGQQAYIIPFLSQLSLPCIVVVKCKTQ